MKDVLYAWARRRRQTRAFDIDIAIIAFLLDFRARGALAGARRLCAGVLKIGARKVDIVDAARGTRRLI